jgi:DNA-3-methyladenine glycosylase II
MSNEAVIAVLADLPGIGRWTGELFLIFGLGRPDVWSEGDAGLKRAVRSLFGSAAGPGELAERWKPFRSVASWYLWRYLEGGKPPGRTPV